MSIHLHIPAFPLSQYVSWLWYYVDFQPDHDREHVLPDGTFELIINLEDRPRKLFRQGDSRRHTSFRRGWLSGTHTGYLVIDALASSSMIGAHFKPGGAAAFLGLPAGELCDQVVEMDAIWGPAIWEWRDQLLTVEGAGNKLRLLEKLLLRKLENAGVESARSPAVCWALERFVREPHLNSVRAVSNGLGMSHKHFIDKFRGEVGLTPKIFCRIRRFHEVLGNIQSRKAVDWADVAYSCGYYDQAHFVNDFGAFAGLNPSTYLRQRLEGDPRFARAV